MKIKYIGPDLPVTFKNNKIYEVLEVDKLSGGLRIIDESEDDYLYSPTEPKLLTEKYQGGIFEIIEDDECGSLAQAIYGNINWAAPNLQMPDINIKYVSGK